MLWLINCAACMLLMYYLLQVGHVATRWRHKVAVIGALLLVSAQALDRSPGWYCTALTVSLAVISVAWRRPLWGMIHRQLDRRQRQTPLVAGDRRRNPA